jgi:3alpha(or 20beta)-hydroxysteroid dehydrogenase
MGARLEGKVAIVTGAAGGIGAAVARRFVNEGARVLFDRHA